MNSKFFLVLVTAVLSLATVFKTSQAQAAYIVVSYNQPTIDVDKRSHFVISSKGNDLGLLPQLSALTKAAKLKDVYPDDQVILILPEENSQNLRWLHRMGLKESRRVDALLDTKQLFTELSAHSQIVSMHTYGHSAIPEGVFLDAIGKRDIRWYPTLSNPKQLVGHFTSDAFVTLNGCNLGHSMAPMLARLWKIPVAGALTGSHFEVLGENGLFAPVGPEKDWAKSSLGIYREPSACIRGCVRMRPSNSIYDGHYGKYRQGLVNYKFFCSGISEDECLKGMARSLISSVTTNAVPANATREQFAQAAREWLCPASENPDFQKRCTDRLEMISMGSVDVEKARFYTPLPGASHQCTFEGCYQKLQCLKPANTSNCAQNEEPPKQSTTFVDEYLYFLRGFELLNTIGSPVSLADGVN